MTHPTEEWYARSEVVGAAWRYLREYEDEERPDADPECLRLARIITEHGDHISGAPMPIDLRQRVREIRRQSPDGPPPPEVQDQLRAVIDELHQIQGEADARVDDAAERLAQLA